MIRRALKGPSSTRLDFALVLSRLLPQVRVCQLFDIVKFEFLTRLFSAQIQQIRTITHPPASIQPS